MSFFFFFFAKRSLQFAPTIPNNHVHFAVGDIADWSGIKRVGRALSMGQCAAVNILNLITADVTPAVKQSSSGNKEGVNSPELQVYPYVPPMIALALGSTAVTYHPDMGVSGGEEAYKTSFGTDLGLSSKLLLSSSSFSVRYLIFYVLFFANVRTRVCGAVCWRILGLPLPVVPDTASASAMNE